MNFAWVLILMHTYFEKICTCTCVCVPVFLCKIVTLYKAEKLFVVDLISYHRSAASGSPNIRNRFYKNNSISKPWPKFLTTTVAKSLTSLILLPAQALLHLRQSRVGVSQCRVLSHHSDVK